ncbi:penicillin-binding protein [Aquibacillus salsiterrae]|uniref:serine-type D-Ala-D-Ala carboxypeptidase n=1 Tax=Aquibacillus salsiterrae TaxID=2950439 RepID=A0A9X4AFR3_9BACI|nr:penicillin-binding transpeptidase domain-containing protein [Aquibacillus salsiterrae]MDC3416485.1 penicillin-binding transpeptidase domain-containing protein [Aquibacillus salsiterrae]
MRKSKTTQVMSTVLMLLFVVVFLTLLGRFLYIQGTGVVSGVSLEEWADKRRTNSYRIDAQRGTIFDQNGMALAQDRAVYRLYAIVDQSYTSNPKEPRHVVDPQKTAEMLAPLLNMDASDIIARIEAGIEREQFQVEFGQNGKGLSQESKDKIEALDLPGINFMKEAERYYPNGVFASQLIGLAQRKNDKIDGVTGIELQLNEQLSGKSGSISYKRDKYDTKLLEPEEVLKEAKNGNNVYLTIDQKIQTFLEDAMGQVDEQYEPERMTAVVMDPKTGEVLAMSNRPSYNPNQLGQVENWYNDVISTPFEPGSTMKIFTLAAAIEEGVYQADETYQSGQYKIDEISRPINDHNAGKGWGEITYEEGMQRSSNVAAAKLVWEKMGPDKFLDYLEAFRFNQPTGIDLPGERPGKILFNWPIEKITTSFGQGTTVTPIQQMMAATAVANDGKMVQPYVISKIENAETNEIITETKPKVVGEPISASTAKKVRDTLETVITSENGTGKVYRLSNYSVAGKTGTAQIPDPENGGYLYGNENYIFSFLGMAPKEEPELMMYISIKQPKLEGNELGSEPVSFIFKNVMENSLQYMSIEPDIQENTNVATVELPDIKGSSSEDAKKELEEIGLNVTVIGDGNIVTTYPKPGTQLLPMEKVYVVTDNPKMPDMTGWSLRDVLKLKDLIGLDAELIGNGYVTKQNIKQGEIIKKGNYLVVELRKPNQQEQSEKSENSTTE